MQEPNSAKNTVRTRTLLEKVADYMIWYFIINPTVNGQSHGTIPTT